MSENVQEEYDDDLRLELQGDLVVNDSPVEVQSPRRMDLLGITRTRAGESVVVVVGRQGLELYCWRLSNIEASTRKQYEIRRGKPPRRRQGEVLAPEWTIHGFQHGGITKLATSHGLSTIALTISTLGSISYVQTRNTSETPGHIIATTEVPDDLYIDVALDISGQRGYAVSASGILSIIDVRKNRIQALPGISAASVACHPSQAEIIVIGNKGSGGARILLLQQSVRTKSLPTFPEKIDTHCISWLDNESIFTGLLPDPQVFDQAQGAVLHISRSINKEKAASSIATYPDDLPDLESQACETHIYFSQSWPAWNCAIVAHSNSNDVKVLRRDDSYGVSWYVQEPYDESTLKAQTPAAISNDGDDIESNIAGLAIAPSLTNTNAALLLLLSSHGLLSCYDFFNIKDTEDSTNALPPNNQQVTNPATPTAPAQAKNALASLAQVLPSIDQGAALPQIDNSSSSGYPPMSEKPPTPFGLDSSAPAPAKSSSAYPPMSTKPPTPFGLDSSAPAPAPTKTSSGYPPMSTKPPTPFGLNSPAPAPAPAPAKTSSAYPPMSTKPPTPFGLDSSAPAPAKTSSAYPPMSTKPPTPFGLDSSAPAPTKSSSGYPPMSTKPPTPFGLDSSAPAPAPAKTSSAYPPMSTKPPTPFGLDSSAPAPPKSSSAYPPMSTKPPTPFGLNPPAPAPAPAKTSSAYPPMSTKPPTPFGLNPPAPAPAPPKSSSGYPPMSTKPPTPFGLNPPAPAPTKSSSGYPPMSTKPPTPFGLDSSAPAPAPAKTSSAYSPMSTKPPTPFGLNPPAPAPAPAPAKTSSAYPPMSTKPPTPFGLNPPAPAPAKSSSAYPPMSAKPPTPFDSGPTTPAKNNIASKAPSSSSRPPLIPSKTPKETTIASKKHYDIDEGPAPTTEWERQRLQIKREFESTLKQMSEAVSSACDDVDSVRSEMQSLGQDTRSKLRSARSEMSGPNFERREQLARSRAVLLGHCEDLDRQCREVNSDLEVIRGFVLLEDEENISEKRTEAERRAIEAALHWRNVLESRELDAASRARLDRLEHKVKDVLSCTLDVGQVASHRARLAKETKPSAAMYLAKSPRADVAVVMKRLDKIYELALAIQEKVVPDLTQRIGDIQKKSKRLNTPVENGTAEKDTTKKLQAAPPLTPYEDALSRLFESACSTLPSQPRDQRLSAKLAPSTTGKKVPSSRGSVKTSPSISLYNEELRGARNIALTSPLVPLAPAQEEETPISSGRFSSMISTPLRAFDLSAADDKATPKSFPSESKLASRVEKTPLKPIKKASPIKPIETPTEGWFRKSQQVETKAVEPSRLNLKATSLFGAAALPTKDNAQGTALTSLPSALSGATSTTSPPLPATDVSFAKEESAGSTSLSRQDSFVASGSVSFFDQAKSASIDKPDYRSQVEAIYRQYAPEKFDKVNKILNDYAGREEILLKKLNAKYGGNNIVAQAGAPPAPAATTAPAPGMMITPNKLVAEKPLFPSTPLQSDTMRDDNTNQPVNPMFGTGVTPPRSTFGVQPSAFQQQVSPAFPQQQQQPNNQQQPNEDVRARIVEIYQKCNPEKLSSVDAILTKYAGRYDDLLRKLQAKYADQLGRPTLQQAQQGNAFSGAFGAPTPLGGGGLPSALPFSGPPKPTAQPNIGGGFGVYSNMQPTFGSTMPGASPQQQQAQQSTFGAGFSSLSSALSGGGTSQFGGGNTSSFGAPQQQQQPQPFGGGGFFSNSGGAQPQQSSFGGQQQGAFGGYTGAPMQQPAQFGNVSSFGITSPQQQQGISPFSGSSFTAFRG